MQENPAATIALSVVSIVAASVALWLAGRGRVGVPLWIAGGVALAASFGLMAGFGIPDERPEARYSFTRWAMPLFAPSAVLLSFSHKRHAGLALLICLGASLCYYIAISEFCRLAFVTGWAPDGRAYILLLGNLLFVALAVTYYAVYRASLPDASPQSLWARGAELRSFALRGVLLALGTFLTLRLLSSGSPLTPYAAGSFGANLQILLLLTLLGFEGYQAWRFQKRFPEDSENVAAGKA